MAEGRDEPCQDRGAVALDDLQAAVARCGVPDADRRYNLTWTDRLNLENLIQVSRTICAAAQARTDSRGAHFREEHQTPDGEALRDDERHAAVFAWEFGGDAQLPKLHREPLRFDTVHLAQRSYK